MKVRVIHDSPALQIGEDDAGTPYITMVDGCVVGPVENILLLDRHWQEMINAGLVKHAVLESQKTRTFTWNDEAFTVPTASYGPTSCGYDFRITGKQAVTTNNERKAGAMLHNWLPVLDPKKPDSNPWVNLAADVDSSGEFFVIPANSFILCVTEEWFHIPRNCVVQCTGKSTIARSGLIVTITPWEPGWRGHVTIEVSNTSQLPVKFYIGEGVGQALMTVTGSYGPTISYADKGGKYQNQTAAVTHSKYEVVG